LARIPIPVIKERRIQRIVKALKCFSDNPFNREAQRTCVLGLYPSKNEHSVFRGITIQTLRKLGLIIGRSDKIRLTSNAEIIMDSMKLSLIDRAIKAVILEIDFEKFHFVELIRRNEPCSYSNMISHFQDIGGWERGRLKERIDAWLKILIDSGLVAKDKSERITAVQESLETTIKDLQFEEKEPLFIEILLASFSSLHRYGTSGIVDIADLRSKVAHEYLARKQLIVTRSQFDQLLRRAPKITDTYIITFGQPMGSEEELFTFKGNYYRTINIKLIKKE
jgi:hypothetical protein